MHWYQSLIVGEPYYLVGFADRNLKILSISTFIYMGIGALDAASEGRHCFQDAHSFLAEPEEQSEPSYIALAEESLSMIADRPGLIRWIQSEQSTSMPEAQA